MVMKLLAYRDANRRLHQSLANGTPLLAFDQEGHPISNPAFDEAASAWEALPKLLQVLLSKPWVHQWIS